MPDKITEGQQSALTQLKQVLMSLLGSGSGPSSLSINQWQDDEVDISANRTIILKNAEERLVTGVVLEPEVADFHGDIYSTEEIFKGMESFITACRKMKLQHSVDSGSEVVECWQTKNDEVIGEQDIKKGTWMLTTRLPEDEFELVKAGSFTGFSIGCKARGEDIKKSANVAKRRLVDFDFAHEGAEISLVDSAANERELVVIKMAGKEGESPDLIDLQKDVNSIVDMFAALLSGNNNDSDTDEQNEQEEAPSLPQLALDSLKNASEVLNQFLGNPLDLQTHAAEGTGGYQDQQSSQSQFMPMVEKSMKDSDIESVLKSEKAQELVTTLVQKALEPVQEELTSVKKENEGLKAACDILQKSEQSQKDAATAKLAEELGMTEDKDLEVLKAAQACGTEAFDRLVEVIKAGQVEKDNSDLLDQQGVDGECVEKSTDGYPVEVVKSAKAAMEADAGLTEAVAYSKAMLAHCSK